MYYFITHSIIKVPNLLFIFLYFFGISGTYYAAVIENRIDFSGRIVLDVGAGSGILSLFAAQVCLNLWINFLIHLRTK